MTLHLPSHSLHLSSWLCWHELHSWHSSVCDMVSWTSWLCRQWRHWQCHSCALPALRGYESTNRMWAHLSNINWDLSFVWLIISFSCSIENMLMSYYTLLSGYQLLWPINHAVTTPLLYEMYRWRRKTNPGGTRIHNPGTLGHCSNWLSHWGRIVGT